MDPSDQETTAASDVEVDPSPAAEPTDGELIRADTITIGTGTVVGVGCIIGTILLTCLGIAFILLLRLF